MEDSMQTEGPLETRSSINMMIVFATVVSGLVAAYLMYRRGESFLSIAKQTAANPIGSMVAEVKNVL